MDLNFYFLNLSKQYLQPNHKIKFVYKNRYKIIAKSYLVATVASFRAASCNNWVSTSSPGSWTYRTTDPRIKQFLTDNI